MVKNNICHSLECRAGYLTRATVQRQAIASKFKTIFNVKLNECTDEFIFAFLTRYPGLDQILSNQRFQTKMIYWMKPFPTTHNLVRMRKTMMRLSPKIALGVANRIPVQVHQKQTTKLAVIY